MLILKHDSRYRCDSPLEGEAKQNDQLTATWIFTFYVHVVRTSSLLYSQSSRMLLETARSVRDDHELTSDKVFCAALRRHLFPVRKTDQPVYHVVSSKYRLFSMEP